MNIDNRDCVDPSPLVVNESVNDEGNHGIGQRGGPSPPLQQDAISATDLTQTSTHSSSWRHPIRSTNNYLSRLSSVFSWKFLSWLAIQNFALSGGVTTLLWSMCLPLFKGLGVDASRQQLYATTMMSPFALKPFIGVTSDLFPIGGYNKRYLAVLSIALGLCGCAALLVLFHSGAVAAAASRGPSSVRRLADLIVICFFAMNVEGATLDILGEGKYSELMRLHPDSGSSVVSFKFVWSLLGVIVAQCCVGPLADAGRFHVLFWIALALLMAPFYPTFRGWIPETKKRKEEEGMAKLCGGFMFNRGMFREKKIPFVAIASSGLAAPVMSAVSTYFDLGIGLMCSGFVLLALAATTYAVFPRKFFRIQMGMMLLLLCRIRMTSGLNYFYTANGSCLPNGPRFSYTFYITLTGIFGSAVHIVGVILYQTFMSSWRYRHALAFSLVVGSLATIVDLIIIMRWNVTIGIPDKVFFLLGNATFENLTNILGAIPMSAIHAKMAAPGMESAMLAYTIGIGTFCFMISNLLGAGIVSWSGMSTVGKDCNFDDLPYLVVIFQILVPILVGIPATLFIPNVHQTEPLIDWEKERWYEGEDARIDQTLVSDEDEAMDRDALDLRVEPLLV